MHILNESRLWKTPTKADKANLKQLDADAGSGAPFKGRTVCLNQGQRLPGRPAPTIAKYRNHYIIERA